MKNVAVIGTGYVGLVTGTCLAEIGHKVICVDIDKNKIENLIKGIIPIYEPGLEELVKKNFENKSLVFTTNINEAISKSEVVFIAVGTPPMSDGSVNLEYVKSAAESIGKAMNGYKVIVNKSTVPIGTGDVVSRIISAHYKGEFDIVSNPEFLREGSAVDDFMNPDRIVIGNGGEKGQKVMLDLYAPLSGERVMTNIKTAEMIKYASNAYLATSISFINSIANICEKVGADVTEVAQGMRLDKRIGKYAFLNAGVGYGGSCFPKDVKGLIQIAHENNVGFDILESVEATNEAQKKSLLPKIQQLIGENLSGKKIALWGLAFKAETDDMREAPALTVIKQLQDRDVNLVVFDPVASEGAKKMIDNLEFAPDFYKAVEGADCLVITTEWKVFKEADLKKIKSLMKSPNIVDGRNVFNVKEMKDKGFNYISVGR
ncbi:MAG: UDP-glucose 6-dehydrogenase [Candidatus Shapirobacteria bacterium GW2011_GWE1_38_10]|uniref:UDP-glucose 6-dehydrogenase n=1 Tax=Candidatus Shapirobacteria bacterium GW2011_GWE1_38_10 TaxID=1618488 RepID=A0A0G0IGA5_9BACT|nr:MAG: UDP-glucose 6-dehydrogenase [Candidatus Shapirobacteria bacterium GW2011_GWE1_38_10]HBP51127.1 UDP-glucose 6-dehydrogenase [Candidatus Shapirobacteria bacterium]